MKITVGLALVFLIGTSFSEHYSPPVGTVDTNHALHEQRWIYVLSFIAKVYVSEALAANINYSGSYDQ